MKGMHSLKAKITMLTVWITVVAVVVVTLLSVLFIRDAEHSKSDQLLLLLCETGERNLDYYFNSVEKSVKKIASYTEKELDGLEDEKLLAHTERIRKYFEEVASKTNGVLTYYYRIDPAVSKTAKGFWYTDLEGTGFTEHEVTDITEYDTEDTSSLVWFTVPKYEGSAVWLPPYFTENLDVEVFSYNVPIYFRGQFVGVVGIEIDYSAMAEQVDSIRLYNNGYAFLTDKDGNLIFHPRMNLAALDDEVFDVYELLRLLQVLAHIGEHILAERIVLGCAVLIDREACGIVDEIERLADAHVIILNLGYLTVSLDLFSFHELFRSGIKLLLKLGACALMSESQIQHRTQDRETYDNDGP